MMISKEIIRIIQSKLDSGFRLQSAIPLGGGSINQAAKIESNLGAFFIKWNNAKAYPSMFAKEARSLEILRNTKSIHIPNSYLSD